MIRAKALFYWIEERHKIYRKREAGLPKPWTDDPILQQWRFCNVYRELDTVTQWIRENWRDPHHDDPNVWFAMVIARLINWPDTLAEMGYPVNGWERYPFESTVHRRTERVPKLKSYSGAYIVSTNGHAMEKSSYLAAYVLEPLWANRQFITPKRGSTLAEFHKKLSLYDGMGSFMAGQVIADTKYTDLLQDAPDWWTWAAAGPGSKRGMNRVYEYELNHPWPNNSWYKHLMDLKAVIDPMVDAAGMPMLHAQDLQNCLCEFDKMERVKRGEGTPRSGYPGLPSPRE